MKKAHGDHRAFYRGSALGLMGALLTLFVAVTALAATSKQGAELQDNMTPAQARCGSPGAAPCPLQAWMRLNIALALSSNNMSALASGLDRSAKLTPDAAWQSWATFATQGAAAARRGDMSGARAACKGCHDAWREAYRTKYRMRPIPR